MFRHLMLPALIVVASAVGMSADLARAEEKPAAAPKKHARRERPDWEVFNRIAGGLENIKKVTLDLGGIPDASGGGYTPLNPKVHVESTDPKVLRILTRACFYPILLGRQVDPDSDFEGGWGSVDYGTMHIQTDKGEFSIGINIGGLGLMTSKPLRDVNGRNLFTSWLIARQIDEFLFQKTGKHIPDRYLDALSGEYVIRVQKATWKDMYEGRPKKPKSLFLDPYDSE